jgi:hypothetical protein
MTFNFLYKSQFYFVNSSILSVLLGDYSNLRYPYELLDQRPGAVSPRPPLFYDLQFYTFIADLILLRRPLFGPFPRYTFFYFFFGGAFLRFCWCLGSGYRFFPAFSNNAKENKAVGFYDIGFTPLAFLFAIAFFFRKLLLGTIPEVHRLFNPDFFFYRTGIFFFKYISGVFGFSYLAQRSRRNSGNQNQFLLFFILVLGFFVSIPVHFFFRSLFWNVLVSLGYFWISTLGSHSPFLLSFERLWKLALPEASYVPPLSVTGKFYYFRAASRVLRSLNFLQFFGLVRAQRYFGLQQNHFQHTYALARSERFSAKKFGLISDYFGRSSLPTPSFAPLTSTRLNVLFDIWATDLLVRYHVIDVDYSDQRIVHFFARLRSRAFFFMYRGGSLLVVFALSISTFIKAIFVKSISFFRFIAFIFFGPATAYFSRNFFTTLLINYFSLRAFIHFFRLFFAFFAKFSPITVLRAYVLVAADAFSPLHQRFSYFWNLWLDYAHLFTLKTLLRRIHYETFFSRIGQSEDHDHLTPHLSNLEFQEMDFEDFYDTDLAVGEDYDASFLSDDLHGFSGFSHDDATDPDFDHFLFKNYGFESLPPSTVADRIVPTDFFQPDAYDLESNITQVWLFETFFPNFYSFYQREQYKRLEKEIAAFEYEPISNPAYYDDEDPVDYRSEQPNTFAAERMLAWSNDYKRYLDKWSLARNNPNTASEFPANLMRAPGLPLGDLRFARLHLNSEDLAEVTAFVAQLVGVKQLGDPLSFASQRASLIWDRFEQQRIQSPDSLFKKILAVKSLPRAFENKLLYPTRPSHFHLESLNTPFRLWFGAGYETHWFFRLILKIFTFKNVAYTNPPLYANYSTTRLSVSDLAYYFNGYITAFDFSSLLRKKLSTPYDYLLVSSYLRLLSVTDFPGFFEKVSNLRGTAIFEIAKFNQTYGCAVQIEKPIYAKSLTFSFSTVEEALSAPNLPLYTRLYAAARVYLAEPNSENFKDFFFNFFIRKPFQAIFRALLGLSDFKDVIKIPPRHPIYGLTPLFFIPNFFESLGAFRSTKRWFSRSWFPSTEVPKPIGPFPRPDDISAYDPELRSVPYAINPAPNDHFGWLGISPFLSIIRESIYDSELMELAYPPQFIWLNFESRYAWDQENDADQLDLYGEYMHGTTDFFSDDTEEPEPSHFFMNHTEEDDIDSLSSDPDVEAIGETDPLFENVSYEDINTTFMDDSEDADFGFDTHAMPYNVEDSEYSAENYSEDEWQVDEFGLFSDVSVPLSRLFFGGLRLSGAFPATDPRLILGTLDQASRDSSLHYSANFATARANAESTVLVPSSPTVKNGHSYPSKVRLFFKIPLVALVIRLALYAYLTVKDMIYTSIFFDFQTRPDVLKTKMHFLALQHYFRWSSFYGNKYYFQKFSSALADWLLDFESFTSSAKSTRVSDFEIYGYFRVLKGVAATTPLHRVLKALPALTFWHSVDSSVLNELEEPYSASSPLPNPDHPDRWTLFERQRFASIADLGPYAKALPTVSEDRWSAGEKLNDSITDEHTYNHEVADVSLEGYANYDDAALFTYSMDVEFQSHLEEFNTKAEIYLSAILDLLALVRDYAYYGARLFTLYYIVGPFKHWVVFSERFWLELSIRVGFWVNIVRYFFIFSIYFALVLYLFLVIPRITYYFIGDHFSTSLLLICASLLSFVAVLLPAFFLFNPVYNFFRSLTPLESHGLFYLVLFTYFQYVFFGYNRAGVPNSLDSPDFHGDIMRLHTELNYDVAHDRVHLHNRRGFVAHYNQETQGFYSLIDAEYVIYNRRSRQRKFWRGQKGFGEWAKRSQVIDLSYSRAPLSFATFFHAFKGHAFKIRTRAFTGYRYIRYHRARVIPMAAVRDFHMAIHRGSTAPQFGADDPRLTDFMRADTVMRTEAGHNIKALRNLYPIVASRRRQIRVNRQSYFPTRRDHDLSRTGWTPFPYDFRVKSLDHYPDLYAAHLFYVKKPDLALNKYGISPRERNYLVRMPSYRDYAVEETSRGADPEDLFYQRPRSTQRDAVIRATYQSNSTVEDIFGQAQFDESHFLPRKQQPKAFYRRNFKIYSYGDWKARRSLLASSYSFKKATGTRTFEHLGQYYYFIRKRAADLHFSNHYSKNLRDFLLRDKPTRSFVFADIYGPTNELEHLSKISTDLISYKSSPHSFEAFSKRRPYLKSSGILRRSKLPGFLTDDRSTRYKDFRKYYSRKGQQQSTTYIDFCFPFLDVRHAVTGAPEHHPTKLVLTKKERAQFLAAARAIRSVKNYDRLNRLKQQFSNFHLYKQIIPAANYPRQAMDLFLAFESFKIPSTTGYDAASSLVIDPYYKYTSGHTSIPRAYGPNPTKKFSSATGYDFTSNHARHLREYDPVHLYDLPKDYTFYAFLPTAYNATLRFSNIFDNVDVYSEDMKELAFFNRSPDLGSEYLRDIAEYEDYLDDYLNRRPDPEWHIDDSNQSEHSMIAQFAWYIRLYFSLDLYERLPYRYDPFNVRPYNRVRSMRRYLGRKDRFMVGEYRKSGIPRYSHNKEHPRRFNLFADHLAAVSDYSRVKSLDKIYFSDFQEISRRSRGSLLADLRGNVPAAIHRKKILNKYFTDPVRFRRAYLPRTASGILSRQSKLGLISSRRRSGSSKGVSSNERRIAGHNGLQQRAGKKVVNVPTNYSWKSSSKKYAGDAGFSEQKLRGSFRPTSGRRFALDLIPSSDQIAQRRLNLQANVLATRERRRQKFKAARESSSNSSQS